MSRRWDVAFYACAVAFMLVLVSSMVLVAVRNRIRAGYDERITQSDSGLVDRGDDVKGEAALREASKRNEKIQALSGIPGRRPLPGVGKATKNRSWTTGAPIIKISPEYTDGSESSKATTTRSWETTAPTITIAIKEIHVWEPSKTTGSITYESHSTDDDRILKELMDLARAADMETKPKVYLASPLTLSQTLFTRDAHATSTRTLMTATLAPTAKTMSSLNEEPRALTSQATDAKSFTSAITRLSTSRPVLLTNTITRLSTSRPVLLTNTIARLSTSRPVLPPHQGELQRTSSHPLVITTLPPNLRVVGAISSTEDNWQELTKRNHSSHLNSLGKWFGITLYKTVSSRSGKQVRQHASSSRTRPATWPRTDDDSLRYTEPFPTEVLG